MSARRTGDAQEAREVCVDQALWTQARETLAYGRVVVLAGSGLMQAAGMTPPEARGGLWDQLGPTRCATPEALAQRPDAARRAFGTYLVQAQEAQQRVGGPSAAHRALWGLEQAGLLRGVIALTTGGLVRAAGVERVTELFGAIDRGRCRACHTRADALPDDAAARWSRGAMVTCPACGDGELRPTMLLLGEAMARRPRARAAEMVYGGRSLLVVGADIRRPPMRKIPVEMRKEGGSIIAVGDVDAKAIAAVRGTWIKGDVGEVLPELLRGLERTPQRWG